MHELLKHAEWRTNVAQEFGKRVFQQKNPVIAGELSALWRKYHGELTEFSNAYSKKYQVTTASGFSATFGDIEGELLYILIRELKPDLIYEISPNSGCSTNYLLAAVTRNGNGRVEGFEIEPSFNGVPTRDAIAGNQISLCDISKYTVHIGDARKTVAERLKTETPNFCLIDSWHEDVFAEFYVHQLLPRVQGAALIQDIAHFDPRPEWSTEAAYLLTYLQLTGTELVSIATYEDFLNTSGVRNGLVARRPKRSNSIILHTGQTSALPSPVPGKRYRDAWNGHVDEENPAVCDILAMWHGRAPVTRRSAERLVSAFKALDLCLQVLTIELLAKNHHRDLAANVLGEIDPTALLGSQLPLFLARAGKALERIDVVDAMALKIHEASADTTIATAYRQLLELADLQYQVGHSKAAQSTFDTATNVLRRGSFDPNKISVDLAAFCLRHPAHFAQLNRAGLGIGKTLNATAVAGRALLLGAAARTARRLRANRSA